MKNNIERLEAQLANLRRMLRATFRGELVARALISNEIANVEVEIARAKAKEVERV